MVREKKPLKKATAKTNMRTKTVTKSIETSENRSRGSSKENGAARAKKGCRLVEGRVDPSKEHIGLRFKGDKETIARIAPGRGKTIKVQYLAEPDRLGGAKRYIESILDLGEEFAWEYAAYHCGTRANFSSSLQWFLYPDSSAKEGQGLGTVAQKKKKTKSRKKTAKKVL